MNIDLFSTLLEKYLWYNVSDEVCRLAMESMVGRLVLPGDMIAEVDASINVVLGGGILQRAEKLVAIKAGVLRMMSTTSSRGPKSEGSEQVQVYKYWVENNQKRVCHY